MVSVFDLFCQTDLTNSVGNVSLTVQANIPFSKRYLKYLTKKYLKKSGTRDWLRIIASSKDNYLLQFYNIAYVSLSLE